MDSRRKTAQSSHWYKKIAAIFMSTFALAGCVTTGGGNGWPVETYPNACGSTMIPFEPICLSSADYYGGFKYGDQLSACRQSMSYYINALDEYYRCSDEKLKGIFNELLKKVSATYSCYVEYFQQHEEGDPSVKCPPVDVPRFYASHEAGGVAIDLGVPRCIVKSNKYNFSPKNRYQLDDCHEQVEVFMGKGILSSSYNATSAQEQYDTYLRNMRRVLDQKANYVVSKFNCIAEKRKYCI
ncbi:MAG TPA: hypothetical protein VIQ81_08345 [Gammaproteobacteria bacterium]